MKDIIVLKKTRTWRKDGKAVTTEVNEPCHTCLPQALPIVLCNLINALHTHDPEQEKGFDAEWLTAIQGPRKVRLLDRNGNALPEIRDCKDVASIVVTYGSYTKPVLTETFTVTTLQTGWRFIGEEEVGDPDTPVAFLGVLTNGEDTLYYQVTALPDGSYECTLFNSITFEDGSEEVTYPWTADNDQRVVDALDAVTDRRLIAGEESVLRDIKFKL